MMNISIVITTLNKRRMIQQRLYEIYRYLSGSDIQEIIISNDDKTDEELVELVKKYDKKFPFPLFIIDSDHPTSFSANVNRGVNQVNGEYLIITQDDVQISGNFLRSLKSTLTTYESSDKCCIAGKLLDHDTGWNKFHGHVVPYIEGWFIACRRDVWDDIGGMDEEIAPYDAEDIDLAIRAREKGYILVDFSTPHLQHIRGQTITLDEKRRKITEKNVVYVRDKWSEEELKEIYNE